MNFVIFTLLFAGACFAAPQQLTQSKDLLDSAGTLLVIEPDIIRAAAGLRSIHDTTSKLAEIIDESEDASPAFSSFAVVLSQSIEVLNRYAEANQNLSNAIKNITGNNTITRVDILNPSGLKKAVNGLADSENGVSSIFNDTINGIGTLSGYSGDLSNAASGFESAVRAKKDLKHSLDDAGGVTGAALKATIILGGGTIETKNAADGTRKLTKAMQSKISDSNGVDFSKVIRGMNDLATAEDGLVDALNDFLKLNRGLL